MGAYASELPPHVAVVLLMTSDVELKGVGSGLQCAPHFLLASPSYAGDGDQCHLPPQDCKGCGGRGHPGHTGA